MEFDIWVWLNEQKEHLAIIAGILGGLWTIWKYLGKHIKECFSRIVYMFNAKSAHGDLNEKLEMILLQLVPNGGSSIKDSLDRIEDKQSFFSSFLQAQMHVNQKAIFQTDEEGKCIWVNRPHARLTGFQSSEVMGDGWINVIAPECRQRTMAKWEDAVEAGREFDENLWYLKKDKVTRYMVNVHAYKIEGVNGELKGYIGEVTYMDHEQTEPVTNEQRREMDRETL